MSHFTVLIIGDDPEDQLAPFDENGCFEQIDATDEVLAKAAEPCDEYHVKAYPESAGKTYLEHYGSIEDLADEYFGYQSDGNGGFYYETNPNAKWDWYQLGGRWCGYFKLKNGAEGEIGDAGVFDNEAQYDADQARKGDIDFEGMRQSAADNAREQYQKFVAALGDNEFPPKFEEFRQQFGDDIDAARKAYWSLPSVEAVKDFTSLWEGFEGYCCTEEQFVERARRHAIATYAVLKDGEWYERGRMGWWGISTNEMDEAEWAAKVGQLIDDLPDDTLLSVYDCHI